MLRKLFFLLILLSMTLFISSCGSLHQYQKIATPHTEHIKIGESGYFCAVNPADNIYGYEALSQFGFLTGNAEMDSKSNTGSEAKKTRWNCNAHTVPEAVCDYSGAGAQNAGALSIRDGKFDYK